MQDGAKLEVPLPAPRNAQAAKPPDRKTTISPPFNFRHVSHVGTDFKSEDVRRAIRPVSKLEEIDNLPQAPSLESEYQSDGYEKVSPRSSDAGGAEQGTLSPSAHYENISAFKVGGNSVEATSSNVTVFQRRKQSMDNDLAYESNDDVVHSSEDNIPKAETPLYENVASTQSKVESSQGNHEDTTDNHEAEMRARLSKKKLPAPPPPPVGLRSFADKESRTDETPVLWRPQFPSSPPKPESEIIIKTPDKIEQHCTSSVVLERPNILGADTKIGLDDAIPLTTSVRDSRDCNPSTTSDAKPILDRSSAPVPKPRTANWMMELPEEERNRISTLWEQATGESEVPDDRCRVKETVAMYEGRLKKGPPPRPPPPSRRRAPPPPTVTNGFSLVHQTACDHPEGTPAVEDGERSCAPTMNGNDQSASGEEHVEASTTLPQGPEEVPARGPLPHPEAAQQPLPVPKPRKVIKMEQCQVDNDEHFWHLLLFAFIQGSSTKRLEKPEEVVDMNSATSVDMLAECFAQCVVTPKRTGAVGEATYVIVDRAGKEVLEKVRATFTVCDAEHGHGSRKGSRGDVEEDRVDSGCDSDADVEITRF